jgi:hypothetical protein
MEWLYVKQKSDFDIYHNKIVRARSIVCRHFQVPGLDLKEGFSPGWHEQISWIVLLAKILRGLKQILSM